ncbi:transcriptional regulator [Salinisphaera sp. S4-8]|uniref:MarR family winged helix-turn-helix transcriptional regulator n=1 Tax=Salinisphaera sp. S4-8 TaxID=633357 RepID=UPI0033416BBA
MHSPIGETLHQLLHAYKRAMRDGYATAGIELSVAQIRMIKGIASHPGTSAQDISARARQDKGHIARLIKDLESEGLLTRYPHPQDSRYRQLELTPAGSTMAERIRTVEAEAGARMARALPETDIKRFVELAEAMIVNLETHENPQ